VHERNFQQVPKPLDLNSYESFLKKLLLLNNFNRQKQRIVVFGLPRTGKTTFGNILLGVPMTAKQVDNQFKISFEKS